EQGSHTQLLEAGGAYHRLYWSQFASGVDPDADEAVLEGSLTVTGEVAAVTGEVAAVTGEVGAVTDEVAAAPGEGATMAGESGGADPAGGTDPRCTLPVGGPRPSSAGHARPPPAAPGRPRPPPLAGPVGRASGRQELRVHDSCGRVHRS